MKKQTEEKRKKGGRGEEDGRKRRKRREEEKRKKRERREEEERKTVRGRKRQRATRQTVCRLIGGEGGFPVERFMCGGEGAAGRVTPLPTRFMVPGLTTHCSAGQ